MEFGGNNDNEWSAKERTAAISPCTRSLKMNEESQNQVAIFFEAYSGCLVPICLEPEKIDSLKMLDLQKKSAIDSDNLQV